MQCYLGNLFPPQYNPRGDHEKLKLVVVKPFLVQNKAKAMQVEVFAYKHYQFKPTFTLVARSVQKEWNQAILCNWRLTHNPPPLVHWYHQHCWFPLVGWQK